MIALWDIPKEKRELVEAMAFDGHPISFMDLREPQKPYLQAVKDIAQFLEEHGFEDASNFLDKHHNVFMDKSCEFQVSGNEV